MAAKNFRGWLRLKGFVAAASGYWRRLGGLLAATKVPIRYPQKLITASGRVADMKIIAILASVLIA